MIHLPQTGLQALGSKLQLFNLQTTAPTDKTFEYRSFGHILSLLKQKLKFQVFDIRNGGLQPPQCSPMGPNFFLAAKWLHMLAFGHMNRKGCFRKPKNRKTGGAPPDLGAGRKYFDFGGP